MKPILMESIRHELPRSMVPLLERAGGSQYPFALAPETLRQLRRFGKQLRTFQKGCNDLYALSLDGRQPEWIARLIDQGQIPGLTELGRQKALRNYLPSFFRADWISSATGFQLAALCHRPAELPSAARLQSAVSELQSPVVGGKTGISDAGQNIGSERKPQSEELLWLALLFARPLRAFWRRALSDRHFESLQRVVPLSWVMDPAPLPPQSVIADLGIQNFQQLAVTEDCTREFVLRPTRTSADPENPTSPACTLLASHSSQESVGDVIQSALDRFHEVPHVLSALLPGHGFLPRIRTYFSFPEDDVQLAGVFMAHPTALDPTGSETVWMPAVEA
jgi:hypothetical protein